jgi:FkbM family methyltransferase
MKRLIKETFGIFGLEISHKRPRPRSNQEPSLFDPFHEQQRFLGRETNGIIFDVGAHTGETTLKYRRLFPRAQIHAFEPFVDSYLELKKKTENDEMIHNHNIALGRDVGRRELSINRSSATNSLLSTDPRARETWNDTNVTDTVGKTEVLISTIDEVAQKERIPCIDILKLDVQGAEYDVVLGAADMIRSWKIKYVYSEIIIMPTYVGQKELDEFLQLMREMGFVLHNFYNGCFTNDGRINQTDCLLGLIWRRQTK